MGTNLNKVDWSIYSSILKDIKNINVKKEYICSNLYTLRLQKKNITDILSVYQNQMHNDQRHTAKNVIAIVRYSARAI